jgi:hypothetical protein
VKGMHPRYPCRATRGGRSLNTRRVVEHNISAATTTFLKPCPPGERRSALAPSDSGPHPSTSLTLSGLSGARARSIPTAECRSPKLDIPPHTFQSLMFLS